MNPEVENQIRNNIPWAKLPTNIRQLVGNSQKEYEKSIVSYCIRNQARFKDTLVRYVRKDEKRYYEELLQYSKEHYMLYPYHLSDLFVRGLRITPFNYYLDMMADLMTIEKSYDTLPNFTAIDCVRLLGIGRNQYIDIMNRYRSSNRLRIGFGRRKPIRSLLPTQPCPILIEPWWSVNVGCITDDDVKLLSEDEKNCIDMLIDNRNAMPAGKLDYDCVHFLYKKGLIYLDVPVIESDFIEVPPLEGFVMNRITGDYFETILYKIFVSIDDRTSLGELASLLQIDVDLVLNAVSLYCRLSFAKKKSIQSIQSADYRSSWADYAKKFKKDSKPGESLLEWSNGTVSVQVSSENNDEKESIEDETNKLLLSLDTNASSKMNSPSPRSSLGNIGQESLISSPTDPNHSLAPVSPQSASNKKRIGFLFDSTLTAFLMMGNLSSGLKNHAVTMFEVGKLTDQALDNFLSELDKVSNDHSEGEAQRYFEHARILKSTIQFLRYNPELKIFSGYKSQELENGESKDIPIEDEPLGVDLLRCESLASLDEDSRQRILAKNYSVLFSMAPYSSSGDAYNSPPITCNSPYHIGPAIPEMNSVWFKFYLYELTGNGPCSVLIPKGHLLSSLPKKFLNYDKFMITTWGHDPIFTYHSNLLITLNDAIVHGPILVECYGETEDGARTINVPFNDNTHPLFEHPTVKALHEKLSLEYFSGYITLLNPYNSLELTENHEFKENLEDWVLLDVRFGIPLFENKLNLNILSLLKEKNLCTLENLNKMLQANRRVSLELVSFIQKYQSISVLDNDFEKNNQTDSYLIPIINNKSKKSNQTSVVIYPTKCILFDNGLVSLYKDF